MYRQHLLTMHIDKKIVQTIKNGYLLKFELFLLTIQIIFVFK